MNKVVYRFISIIVSISMALGTYFGVRTVSASAAEIDALQVSNTRMLIPLYSDPPAQWASVVNANTYKNIDVIINPSDGPGTSLQNGYLVGITQLRSAGIGIFGYVYTGYGTRPLSTVEAEVDAWKNWYGVDGIFFDEADNKATSVPYYLELQTYVAARAMKLILNPGTDTIESYVTVANVNIIYETDPSNSLSTPLWVANYSASKFGALQYAANIDQMRSFVDLAKSKNIGYVFVTDDVLPNPWDGLPAYLAEEAALLANGPVLSTPTTTAVVTQTSILPTILPTFTLTPVPATLTALPAVTPTVLPTEHNVVEARVGQGIDDVEESSTGYMYINSSDLELVYDESNQVIGLRFAGMNIPKGVTITNAYLQFKVDETSSEFTNLLIQGEVSPNALAFTQKTQNVSSRLRTTNSVGWSPTPWQVLGAAGVEQQTPNLAPVLQEIVNQANWVVGNSLVIIITGTGHRVAEAYEVDPVGAPLLHVEYTIQNLPATLSPTLTATVVPSIVAPTFTSTSTLPVVTPTFTTTPVPATATPTTLPVATATAIPPTAEPPSPTPVPPTVAPTSEPPTPTVGPQNPPTSETVYDDTDGAFVYSRGWNDVSKRRAYNGSYMSTDRNDSYATFTFNGQSFSVIYSGGTTFRTMNVYVDDALVGTIDERASESTFQQRWDYPGQLTPGQHVLKFVFVASGRRTNGSIDAVIVR